MLDSNIASFSGQTSDRLTRIVVSDVCKTKPITQHSHDKSLSTLSETQSVVCQMPKRTILNQCSNAVINPVTELLMYPLYTLKSPWFTDSDDSYLNVTDVCKNITQEYNNSDIVIYDTVRDKIKFNELGVCTRRKIISFVYVNGKFGKPDRFMNSLKNLCTGDADNRIPVIVVLDRLSVGDDIDQFLCFEYIIKLNHHNCSLSQVSKFMAYIIKSFQKYQTVFDMNTCVEAVKHTIINYDLYSFMGLPNINTHT